jgi:hypothetical protein
MVLSRVMEPAVPGVNGLRQPPRNLLVHYKKHNSWKAVSKPQRRDDRQPPTAEESVAREAF